MLFVTTACASGPEALPFADEAQTTTTTAIAVADDSEPEVVIVPDETDAAIAFHARWMCELQRRNFADLELQDAALGEALAAAGVTRAEYDGLLALLPESQALRDEALSLFDQQCRA